MAGKKGMKPYDLATEKPAVQVFLEAGHSQSAAKLRESKVLVVGKWISRLPIHASSGPGSQALSTYLWSWSKKTEPRFLSSALLRVSGDRQSRPGDHR